jgi:hypothetical protein
VSYLAREMAAVEPSLGDSPVPELREGLTVPNATVDTQRRAVRESLSIAIAASIARCGKCYFLAVLSLLVGAGGVAIWSESIYEKHYNDACNEPLAPMLRIFYVLGLAIVFQSEITRWCLCYNPASDGPEVPMRVAIFRCSTRMAIVTWPLIATVMLAASSSCSQDLRSAVRMIVLYYLLLVVVIIVIPAFFISIMLVLVRRGLVRAPVTGDRAPEGFIDNLQVVAYEPSRFDDQDGDFSSTCAICLDNFGQGQKISRTPCPQGAGHAFHTECLSGWLQCSRTCPLCRVNLVDAASNDPRASAEQQTTAADSANQTPTRQSEAISIESAV